MTITHTGLDYYESMKSFTYALTGLALALSAPLALSQTPAAAPVSAPAFSPAPVPPASVSALDAPPLQSRMDARLMYELLLGEFTFQEGEPATGAAFMLDAAQRTGDEALYQRATDMAIRSRSGPAALQAARAWRQAKPDSIEAARYELQVLIVLNRLPETEEPVRALVKRLPVTDKEAFLVALPALYQRAPDRAEATRTVEAALRPTLEDAALAPAAWTTVGRMRLATGDKVGALQAARLGQMSQLQAEWPALLALQLLASAQVADAEPLLLRYLESGQPKPEVRIGYARALIDLARPTEAMAQMDLLTAQQPDYPEGWLIKGALLADERQDAKAEQTLRHYLQLVETDTGPTRLDRQSGADQARLMLARIAERHQRYDEAEQLLAAITSPDQAMAVQLRRANLLARQGRMAEARQAIRSVPELQPDDTRTKLLAEAQLLRDHGMATEAYQLLTEALKTDPDDEALLYDAAMAAESAERLSDMEQLLRRLIELNPRSANAYNALGYSLADRGERLPEAKQLIEKAVQLAPDDHYIQDSLGWVEFRLGNMPQAKALLEGAYNQRPDAEIAAHLGEVLWLMGEREAARTAWRNGLRLDPGNDTLNQTLKRLKVGSP